ncbi:hypothetical protein [Pleionea litopenaei]|uniref:Uncharacterized protein n=1 Tax=Pleionea litopenaei TaxID=3070815 RepID=A0AA51RVT2_9GAMM|nr:hypothetical protein [Pleionea sp. HL-JVS1]WMS88497.1 hypothetical protein Q9312_06165 [Pleionea sp. HL-JVS1]
MRKAIIGCALLMASLPTMADECKSWGCVSTISELYTNADGRIYIGTPLDEKLANCTPISDIYFTLNPSSGNAKEIYSSLLAAFMANRKIQLRIKEGHAQCELSYVRLNVDF